MEEASKTMATPYANDGISSIGASEFGSSKCDLVSEGGIIPNERFEKKYGKWWPFRLLKTINLLVLLAITIAAANCGSSDLSLNWSKCWNFVRAFYDPYANWNNSDKIFYISRFILALAFILFVLHWIAKKKAGKWRQFMASFGIVDICLSLFMALVLTPILYSFTCRSIAEIRWFILWSDQLTTTQSSVSSILYSYWDEKQQESRRKATMFRLWMDPTIAILTFLAIFLNLVYGVRLLLLFKRTKVWSSDYRGMHPNCSKLDMAYAKFWPFGLLKATKWILPLVAFPLCMYMTRYDNTPNVLTMPIITLTWFFQWLFYVQKVRLNLGSIEDQQQQEQHDLARRIKKDLVYSGAAILVYLFLRVIIFSEYERSNKLLQVLLIVLIVLHAASVFLTILLLKRHAGPNAFSGFGLKIPGYSVNVNISVNVHKYDVALSAIQKAANANVDVEEGGGNAK